MRSKRTLSLSISSFLSLNSSSPFPFPLAPTLEMPNICLEILSAWNPLANARDLVIPPTKNRAPPLDGLRVLACLWVVAYHTSLFFPIRAVSLPNYRLFQEITGTVAYLPVMNGDFGVDVFFVLSGYLIMAILLHDFAPLNHWLSPRRLEDREEAHLQEKHPGDASAPLLGKRGRGVDEEAASSGFLLTAAKLYGRFIAKRFLRIMPAYALTGIFTYFLLSNVPCDLCETMVSTCPDVWWTNLLFINNFFPYNEGCVPWSWSIAIEFQMYAVSPFVVMVVLWKPRFSKIFLLGLSCISVVLYAVLHWHYPRPDDSSDFVYSRPYTRMFAYFFGMLAAVVVIEDREWWAVHEGETEEEGNRFRGKVLPYFYRVVAITGILLSIYTKSSSPGNLGEFANYVGRPLFAASTAYTVRDMLSPVTPNGTLRVIYSWFLSTRLMYILAQLSYSIYLLHLTFLFELYAPLAESLEGTVVTFWLIAGAFVTFAAAGAAGALVVYFVIEKPFINLGVTLLSTKKKKRPESSS